MSVRNMKGALMAACLGLTVVAGCDSKEEPKKEGDHEIWFMGSVIDGATGGLVTGYTMTLVYGSHTVNATVDAAGRYVVGPLPAWNDYGILISAAGYRAFSSYNPGISPPAPSTNALSSDVYTSNTMQTKDFNAYLFPDSIAVPSTTITIIEMGPNAMPATGSIRLQPTSASVIQGQASEVPMQLWTNDNDFLASAISGTFEGGTFAVPSDQLVYGVAYQIVVYGVTGYQAGSGTLQGGVQNGVPVSLAPAPASPLTLIAQTPTTCTAYNTPVTASLAAQIVFTFNQKIEDATTTAGKGPEVLDNAVTASTLAGYGLKGNVSSTVQERGTSFTIADNTLTIAFNPSVGLSFATPGDVLQYVTYSGLSSIFLQVPGHPEQQKVALSSLLNGMTSINCTM